MAAPKARDLNPLEELEVLAEKAREGRMALLISIDENGMTFTAVQRAPQQAVVPIKRELTMAWDSIYRLANKYDMTAMMMLVRLENVFQQVTDEAKRWHMGGA